MYLNARDRNPTQASATAFAHFAAYNWRAPVNVLPGGQFAPTISQLTAWRKLSCTAHGDAAICAH